MGFEFKELELKGAYLINMFYAGDNRGGFTKSFEKDIFKEAGIDFLLNETFASVSMKNVIRGLHFQKNNPQAKIVSVVCGSAWDVIVDLRPDSATYRKWEAYELNSQNHLGFYIPRGFAHGFLSLEDETIMLYQCEGKYEKENDTGIIFNDTVLNITWPINESIAVHSERDLKLMTLHEYEQII